MRYFYVGVLLLALSPMGDIIPSRRLNPVDVSQLTGRHETIEFRLPPELTDGAALSQVAENAAENA